MQYHVNGELVPAEEATVNVRDRGFMYGDAAFETMRVYGGSLFEWEAHRARLEETCETLGMPDAVPADLRARIHETLEVNDLSDAYVRASMTRGRSSRGLAPEPDVDPTVVVIVESLPRGGVDGTRVWEGPARVETAARPRIPDAAFPADAKTHNYLAGVLARLEHRRPDGDYAADEALFCDEAGYVAEGTVSNLFFVTNETLRTPNLDGPVLPGVTRSVVRSLARRAGVPVVTGRYTVEQVQAADEAFLTNTTGEVRPVASVDGSPVGGGPVTRRLRREFDRRVESCYE
jgi:branched-chain amino acid aminotransferase